MRLATAADKIALDAKNIEPSRESEVNETALWTLVDPLQDATVLIRK